MISIEDLTDVTLAIELLLMDPTFARDMSEKLPDDLLIDDVNKFLQLNLFQNFNNAGAPS